jgi:ABC-type glycerol-3-phosphate transport system substrate-binding protein
LSALSGGKYFADDFTTPAFDKSNLVTMLTTIKNLYTKCKSTPKASLSLGMTELHGGLRSGTTAMTIFGLYRYRAVVAGGAGDDIQWAPAPVYKNGDKQAIYGFELMLNKKSAHKEEAWKFLNFMTSTEAQKIAAEGGEVVARKSAYDAPYFKTDAGKDQLEWSKLILNDGIMPNYTRLSSNFAVILGDAIQKMVLLGGTPDQAADEIMQKYSAAVAQAK